MKFYYNFSVCETLEKIIIGGKEYIKFKDNRKDNNILSVEQFENVISNQKYHKERYFKNKTYEEATEKAKQEEIAIEQKEIEEYNFCNGYTDNKTPLQKGKILKTLNKTQLWGGEFIKRKYLIENLVKNGYIVTQRKENGKLKDILINNSTGNYYVLTKTELDYLNYLIYNKIV